jgi:hypothetical protein
MSALLELHYAPSFWLGHQNGVDAAAEALNGLAALFAFGVEAGEFLVGHHVGRT